MGDICNTVNNKFLKKIIKKKQTKAKQKNYKDCYDGTKKKKCLTSEQLCIGSLLTKLL